MSKCIRCESKSAWYDVLPKKSTLTALQSGDKVKRSKKWCKPCADVVAGDDGDMLVITYMMACMLCGKRASYAKQPNQFKWCFGCAPKDAVFTRNVQCAHEGCVKTAFMSVDPSTPRRYCSAHGKLAGHFHVKIIKYKCVSCDLFQVRSSGGMCSFCTPDSARRRRTREYKVLAWVMDSKWSPLVVSSNRAVITRTDLGQCIRFRPDILLDCGSHFVVVEVDEDQHAGYDHVCESVRMKEIEMQLGLPTAFVRFNPDTVRTGKSTMRTPWVNRTKQLANTLERLTQMDIQFASPLRSKGCVPFAVFLFYNDEGQNVRLYA